jgi:hypothetical protein
MEMFSHKRAKIKLFSRKDIEFNTFESMFGSLTKNVCSICSQDEQRI